MLIINDPPLPPHLRMQGSVEMPRPTLFFRFGQLSPLVWAKNSHGRDSRGHYRGNHLLQFATLCFSRRRFASVWRAFDYSIFFLPVPSPPPPLPPPSRVDRFVGSGIHAWRPWVHSVLVACASASQV